MKKSYFILILVLIIISFSTPHIISKVNEIKNNIKTLENEISLLKKENEDLKNIIDRQNEKNNLEVFDNDPPLSEDYQWVYKLEKLENQNIIDESYKYSVAKFNESNEFSILGLAEIDYEYAEYWKNEIQNCISIISIELNDELKQKLIQTQVNWENSVRLVKEFNCSLYILSGTYGSSGYIMASADYFEKMKSRALELIKYYYILNFNNDRTEDYVFLFKY